jgi:hypothetical protein
MYPYPFIISPLRKAGGEPSGSFCDANTPHLTETLVADPSYRASTFGTGKSPMPDPALSEARVIVFDYLKAGGHAIGHDTEQLVAGAILSAWLKGTRHRNAWRTRVSLHSSERSGTPSASLCTSCAGAFSIADQCYHAPVRWRVVPKGSAAWQSDNQTLGGE